MSEVLIIDKIGGNVGSVYRVLSKIAKDVICSSSPEDILSAKRIIMPGVGHFAYAMDALRKNNIIDSLNEAVLKKQVPVLGICLGMQLMAKFSEEGLVDGLGWFDAEVVRFKFTDTKKYKVPHIGWNTMDFCKRNPLMDGISEKDFFYFVHSYHFCCNNPTDVLATTTYEFTYPSAIQKDNIFGVQFHPEKSYEAGDKLLSNFLKL